MQVCGLKGLVEPTDMDRAVGLYDACGSGAWVRHKSRDNVLMPYRLANFMRRVDPRVKAHIDLANDG